MSECLCVCVCVCVCECVSLVSVCVCVCVCVCECVIPSFHQQEAGASSEPVLLPVLSWF